MAAPTAAASTVDGCWAWVICAAGSFLHVLVIGNVRSTGLLLASVSEHYNRTKRDTSWIISFMYLVFLMLTPVTMALSRRYSVRLIVFLGSGFLSVGFALSYFAESLELLYITIGLLVGLGLAMTHPPTVLILSYYFKRHRTAAMGLTFAGCSIGALCMPPLMNYLIEQYTFRGCMLVWGGLMLNVAVAAALMRPFVADSGQDRAAEAEALIGKEAERATENAEKNAENCSDKSKETNASNGARGGSAGRTNGDKSWYCTSADNILNASGSAAAAAAKQVSRRRTTSTNAPAPAVGVAAPAPAADAPALHSSAIILASCGDISVAFDACAAGDQLEVSHPGNMFARLRRSLKERSYLFCQLRFWLLTFSLSLAVQGMPFNFMVLPQHGKNIGMKSEEYTRLLQFQGITDLAMRMSIGFLADRIPAQRQLLMLVVVIGQGALWCLLLHPTPGAALAFALLEGLLGGILVPNVAPILVENFGVENLPLSYGMLGLLESVVMMSVPVLLGDLFDRTGSWSASIILVAALIGFSGILLLVDSLLQCWSSAKPADEHDKVLS